MDTQKHLSYERRRDRRVFLKLKLQYQHARRVCYTLTNDISAGGVKIMSDYFLPISTILTLQLSLDQAQEIVQATGEVVWIEKLPYSERYKIGVKFKEIGERSSYSIHGFVANI
ncbi:MAG: PilZ domain-containing protein [Candidatus Omnitrophota bacterium]